MKDRNMPNVLQIIKGTPYWAWLLLQRIFKSYTLSTHPSNAERAERLEERIARLRSA